MSSANARGPLWEEDIYRVREDEDLDESEAATRVGDFAQHNVQAMMSLAAANTRTSSSVPPKRTPIPREETALMPAASLQRADAAPVSRVVPTAPQQVGDNALAALRELSASPAPPISAVARLSPPHDVEIRIAPPTAVGFAATIPASWTPAPLVPPRRRSNALVALAIVGVLLAVAVPIVFLLLRR